MSLLPVEQRRDDIANLIEHHQVVVVAGETGSGKSTKLPQICLEIGRGRDGMIGHTQPRRLAARSIATRVAEEIGRADGEGGAAPLVGEPGCVVGYAVRFDDKVGPDTKIKLVTDGIILAEIQRDRLLRAYDTIIIDEAHERSLNIDFLLGYLKQLLPRRPDLKVIITSATIDTDRFAQHFADASGDPAPVIEVTGRSFPVEVRYRELADGTSPSEGIADAVLELRRTEPGDILVFCPGERDIRDAIDAIEARKLIDTEVIPLYARLTSAEQQRIFAPHTNRRIVVATNVAETSLTVPGIRSVIDTGAARISRYSRRTKVQRLPIEAVSQASANQRAGRCGRVAPGVCIRLYGEDDFDARPAFTEPEIQRTNLAAVILQMASLGLGEIEAFPFVDRPDPRSISDGVALLEELDAVDPEHQGTDRWLTPIGRKLARLPVDPRLGRMVLEASELGCVREVVIVAAAMSIQDPRERPSEQRQAADDAHARHVDPASDFGSLLILWDYLQGLRRELSGNQFRRRCKREFIHALRVREWFDLERQLREATKQLRLETQRSADRAAGVDMDAVHRALIAGLLSQVGHRLPKPKPTKARGRKPLQEYAAARGAQFAVAPGSGQRRTEAEWVIAGELVETNRLWARMVAPVTAAWIEDAAQHLAVYRYDAPLWSAERGTATTIERATLFGLPIVAGRTINHRRVDVAQARELFIQHALIERDLEGAGLDHHPFVGHNAAVLRSVEEAQARARVRDLVDEHAKLFEFFDSRLGPDVTSVGHFNRWWKQIDDPTALHLSTSDLIDEAAVVVDEEQFPVEWKVGGIMCPVTYEFDPNSPIDGVIVDIPLDVMHQVDPGLFEWNVPGFRIELVESLMRSLPKNVRKRFLPIPESAAEVTRALRERHDPTVDGFAEAVRSELARMSGTPVSPEDVVLDGVAKHLRPTFRIVDGTGEMLAAGKNLTALRDRLDDRIRQSLATADDTITADGLTEWTIGDLPRVVETSTGTNTVTAYPSLIDRGDRVDVRLLPSPDEQAEAMWTGTRRLVRFTLGSPLRRLDRMLDERSFDTFAKLDIAGAELQTKAAWYEDIITAALDQLLIDGGGPSFTRSEHDDLVSFCAGAFDRTLRRVATATLELIRADRDVERAIEGLAASAASAGAISDASAHRQRLVYPGVVAGVGVARLADIVRYLRGIEARLQALPDGAGRDGDAQREINAVERRFAGLVALDGLSPSLEAIAWQIEELRVSLFAQRLGTTERVSVKRLRRALDDVERNR